MRPCQAKWPKTYRLSVNSVGNISGNAIWWCTAMYLGSVHPKKELYSFNYKYLITKNVEPTNLYKKLSHQENIESTNLINKKLESTKIDRGRNIKKKRKMWKVVFLRKRGSKK